MAQPWYGWVLVLAGWVALILGTFRLDCSPSGLTRRVGVWDLTLAWSDITKAEIRAVPGFGRIRFVLTDKRQHQISFPLFFLDQPSRQRLVIWLEDYVPQPIRGEITIILAGGKG